MHYFAQCFHPAHDSSFIFFSSSSKKKILYRNLVAEFYYLLKAILSPASRRIAHVSFFGNMIIDGIVIKDLRCI